MSLSKMNFNDEIEKLFHDWNYGHPKILYGLIRSMKPASIVEIGCYRGYASAWMAQALKENGSGRLYCIDNFSLTDHEARYGSARAHLEENLRTLAVREFVTILDGDSDKVAWPERVDFAYIDGWHSYTAVQRDFTNCLSRGAECICFDDTTTCVGPRLLIAQLRDTGAFDIIEVMRNNGLTILMCRGIQGPITFSQEQPDHPGIDPRILSRVEQQAHFEAVAKVTGVDYAPIMNLLHDGRA